jgi:hypothetical protein
MVKGGQRGFTGLSEKMILPEGKRAAADRIGRCSRRKEHAEDKMDLA